MRRWRDARDDEGTIGVLTLGFVVLAIMLLMVVSAATSVHLTRLRLTQLADELATDAADAAGIDAYYAATGPDNLQLAEARMRQAVASHLDSRATGSLEGATVVVVEAPDAQTARVVVEITVYPLFGIEALMPFADGITVTAASEARTF